MLKAVAETGHSAPVVGTDHPIDQKNKSTHQAFETDIRGAMRRSGEAIAHQAGSNMLSCGQASSRTRPGFGMLPFITEVEGAGAEFKVQDSEVQRFRRSGVQGIRGGDLELGESDLEPSITKTRFFASAPAPIAAWYHGRDRAM